MTQEDVIGVGKVDLQVPGIFEHRIGVSADVEEESRPSTSTSTENPPSPIPASASMVESTVTRTASL